MTLNNNKYLIFIVIFNVWIERLYLHKLLWISINGIGSKNIDEETMPFLSSIKKFGAFSDNLEVDFLVDAYSSLFTMSTGLHSHYHGIIGEKMCKDNCTKNFDSSKSDKDWWMNDNYTVRPIWSLEKLYQENNPPFCIDWPGCEIRFNRYYPIVLLGDLALDSYSRLNIALSYITKSIITNFVMVRLSEIESGMQSNTNYQNTEELNRTIKNYDKLLENLFDKISKSTAKLGTNILITSSYGESIINPSKIIQLWTHLKGINYAVADEGNIVALYFKDKREIDIVLKNLSSLIDDNQIKIFQHKNLPKTFIYLLDDRTPDLYIVAQNGFCIKKSEQSNACKGHKVGHTLDSKENAGFLFVVGPDINKDIKLSPLNLVDVYPLLCALLLVDPCTNNNGTLAKVVTALSMHHPILSDLPGAKTVITTVIIIAILFTVIAFVYSYISDLYNQSSGPTNVKSYLKSAQTYEIIDQSCGE